MSKADLIAKLLDMRDSADEQDQREIDQLLADPSKRNDEAALQGLIDFITAFAQTEDARVLYQSEFESKREAEQYLEETLIPAISNYIRLFKTQKQRQDEYLVISDEWLSDDLYQSYGVDRDVNDRLESVGIPSVLRFTTLVGGKVVSSKLSTLNAWRRHPSTQKGRLTGLCFKPGDPPVVGMRPVKAS